MTYAVSSALQTAIFQRLSTDPSLNAILGDAIYDAVPAGTLPPLYVSLGAETVRDASDKTGAGALHEFVVSVVTENAGFASAKVAAAAVSDALLHAPPTLERGAIVTLDFYKAKAARVENGDLRQINLIFRARVADDT